MDIPSIDRIAKTINGPNEAKHIGEDKLRELQDIRWGQLKSQEQAHLLRAASYVHAMIAAAAARQDDLPGTSVPPPIPREPRHAAPAEGLPPSNIVPVCRLEPGDVLRLFRQFINRNVTQWVMGAGDHHHPIWALVADHVEGEETPFGPDYAFTSPDNRKTHAILIEEWVDMHNASEAEARGG